DPLQSFPMSFGAAANMQSSAAQHRGRNVADIFNRIAPTTIGVLVLRQPAQAIGNQLVVRPRRLALSLGQRKCADSRGSGEGRGGEFADPNPFNGSLGEESGKCSLIRGAQTVGIDGLHDIKARCDKCVRVRRAQTGDVAALTAPNSVSKAISPLFDS